MTIVEQNAALTERLAALADWLPEEMARWQIPGLAVGIIDGDDVVFAEGFGKRNIEKDLPVDIDTLFAIGSCSKAFTTYDMGLLVDEGKLAWDTPLREYMPDFRLQDPVATELATPRDIVCHRTGLPRHDFMWYGSTMDRRALYQRLRFLPPSQTFRHVFQYQNLMYMTAGVLVEAVSGQTWEDFTRERVFKPLGMNTSQFSVSESMQAANAALPYDVKDGTVNAIPFRNIDSIGPAGSINSSIREMLNWLRLQMNGGRFNGTSLISETTLHEMHSPQMVMKITPEMPWYGQSEVAHTSYGLGWAIQSYRGRTMVRHTGGIDGFIASVSFFPNERVGSVVLSNIGNQLATTAVVLRLCDVLLGLDELPWSDRLSAYQEKLKQLGEKSKAEALAQRLPDTSPSHPLSAYAGTYTHPAYGAFSLVYGDGNLNATFNGMRFTVSHHHYETFQFAGEEDNIFTLASFTTDTSGKIARMSVSIEPAVPPLAFERQPETAPS